jgi:hypothetical protein
LVQKGILENGYGKSYEAGTIKILKKLLTRK